MTTKKDWKKHFLRMKQIADQNLGRAEKSEVLNEDLVLLEKRVSKIKAVCQSTIQRLSACLPLCSSSSSSSKANPVKSFKKLPESMLAVTMIDSASILGKEDTLGITYGHCAKLQGDLAFELFKYAQQVESLVLNPMQSVLETEIPAITRLRKQLTKLTLDMDSAKGRFHSTLKQSSGASSASLSSKVEILRNEMEQAESRVDQCRDQLIIEMYSFLAREGQLSDALLALVNSQIQFHRRTLESLENSLPLMQRHSELSVSRPMFGCSLETHLQQTKQDISLVIEKCVRSLILHGLDEEGLFRVPSSSTKVKKLKAGLDANIVNMEDYDDDPHCIAAVLKSYLRELPEPLMTFELYHDWMHVTQLREELRQNALWVVVDKLPKPNYNNLRYIIKFLAKLAANSNCNKMSPGNIATVIGPSLLWPPGESGPSVLTAASHNAVIGILINRSEWFFPGDLDFGVSESDVVNNARNRLEDCLTIGQSPSFVSSVTASSFLSKYRFFGNIFNSSDDADVKMSPPSKTHLSLNSLTSLNDVDGDFERRKYSFCSLLDERSPNWDSESSSFKSRVKVGMLSLNTTSLLFTNRSPIPSSFTSPAISMANVLSTGVPSPLASVTESPVFSVSPFDFSLGPSFSFSKDAEAQIVSTADVAKTSFSDCGSGSPLDQPSAISHPLSEQPQRTAEGTLVATTGASIESQKTVKGDSTEIPDLLSTVFRSSNTLTTVSKSSVGTSKCLSKEANSATLSASSHFSSASRRRCAFVKLDRRPEKNSGIEGFHERNARPSGGSSSVTDPERSVVSTMETFVEKSPQTFDVSLDDGSNQIVKTVSLNFRVSDDNNGSDVCERTVTAAEDLTVRSSVEKSPWLSRIGAKLGLASRGAPGKERVKLHKAFQRFGFTFHKESHGDRRVSDDLASDAKPIETKQPKKKQRSLSASSPYDVAKPVSSKDTGRRAESVRSSGGHPTVAAGIDAMMMRKNGNALLHLAGSSVLCSTAFGTAPLQPRNIVSSTSTLSSDSESDERAVVDRDGRRRRRGMELSAKELRIADGCVDASTPGFHGSCAGNDDRFLLVSEDGNGLGCKVRSAEESTSSHSGNAVFPFPERSCEGQRPSN